MKEDERALPPLRMPGATLLTRLRAYDTPAPDGERCGTPHLHLVCSELYFVLSGTGGVDLIDMNGYRRVELQEHAAFLFSPGTVHRLLNPDGNLEVLIVMQNSGLPERGDTVATFSADVLENDLAFHQAMQARSLASALERRDRAVEGFHALKAAFERSSGEGRAALDRLYACARARTASRHGEWYEVVTQGAFSEAQNALSDIVRLQQGCHEHLYAAQHFHLPAAAAETVGFCGRLNRYFDPATLLPEGVKIDA